MRISDWSSDVCSSDLDISRVLNDLFDRERTHTESLGGHLSASIQPGLYAKIAAHDLKRVVSNLIENARRYGRSPADDRAYIQLQIGRASCRERVCQSV